MLKNRIFTHFTLIFVGSVKRMNEAIPTVDKREAIP